MRGFYFVHQDDIPERSSGAFLSTEQNSSPLQLHSCSPSVTRDSIFGNVTAPAN